MLDNVYLEFIVHKMNPSYSTDGPPLPAEDNKAEEESTTELLENTSTSMYTALDTPANAVSDHAPQQSIDCLVTTATVLDSNLPSHTTVHDVIPFDLSLPSLSQGMTHSSIIPEAHVSRQDLLLPCSNLDDVLSAQMAPSSEVTHSSETPKALPEAITPLTLNDTDISNAIPVSSTDGMTQLLRFEDAEKVLLLPTTTMDGVIDATGVLPPITSLETIHSSQLTIDEPLVEIQVTSVTDAALLYPNVEKDTSSLVYVSFPQYQLNSAEFITEDMMAIVRDSLLDKADVEHAVLAFLTLIQLDGTE